MRRAFRAGRYNDSVVRKVLQTIARYEMFRPGDRVGVAVSGGADSVALLHCLRELAEPLAISLGVLHLDHQLRGAESDGDRDFVRRLASDLKVRFITQSVDVRAEAGRAGENLEQVGRKLRYQWFTALLAQGMFAKIATGHTQSDQAETVLLRLLRGARSAGLAGIRPRREPGIVRPLIEVERASVVAYLGAGGHRWREDSSNRRLDAARNRIRHELLPRLTTDWNPNLTTALGQLADWARGEEDYWRQALPSLISTHVEAGPDGLYLRADQVARLPVAGQRRLLRAAIEQTRGDLLGIDYEHIEAARRIASDRRGQGQAHLPGVTIRRSFQQVRLSRPSGAGAKRETVYSAAVDVPGTYAIPGTARAVVLNLLDLSNCDHGKARRDDNKEGYNGKRFGMLDWDRVPKPLRLRNWRPGDRYHPQGRAGTKKLKSLFQEYRVAVWERASWPVLAATPLAALSRNEREDVIVWARAFGSAAEFAADARSRIVLQIREETTGRFSESNGIECCSPGV